MPQDPLTNLLLQKQLGQGSDQPLPDTLTPDQEVAQASSPLSALRKPIQGGTDYLLSALGLRNQKPGDLATGLGAATSAVGMAPIGKALGEGSSLLKEIFARNPGAEAVYGRAMAAQAPEMMEGLNAARSSKYARAANAHDALLDLVHSDRPRLIPTETGFSIPIPISSQEAKPSGATSATGTSLSTKMTNLGLTPEIIQDIRSIGPRQAMQKYPHMNINTIYGIASGDSWGSVK